MFLTPAEHLDVDGRKRASTALHDHWDRDHAPRFLVQALGRRKGELHLMQFVRDTVEYKAELDRRAAVKAANWRPFITPYPVQNAAAQEARLELKPYRRWQDHHRDGDVERTEAVEAAILAEADRVAAVAAANVYAMHSSSVLSDVLHHSSIAICTDDHCRGCCVALVSTNAGPIISTATRHKTDGTGVARREHIQLSASHRLLPRMAQGSEMNVASQNSVPGTSRLWAESPL